jgi:tetratricopeptide (TPR) repeat protein
MINSSEIQTNSRSYSSAHRVVLLFFVIVGLVIYSNTFDAVAQYDDLGVFAGSTIDALLQRCTFGNGRLVANLTFTFNYWLSGPSVTGYHIFNFIIHVFTAFLVYQLLSHLLSLAKSKEDYPGHACSYNLSSSPLPPLSDRLFWPSFLGGLLFLVHPLATQAVTYITQRYTSLATLFYVASVVCYLKARIVFSAEQGTRGMASHRNLFYRPRHLLWYGFSILAAVLAMYTKEMSVTLPAIILLVEFLFVERSSANMGRRILYLLPILATGLIIPFHYLPVFKGADTASVAETILNPDKLLPRWAEADYLSRNTYFFSQIGIIWSIYLRLLVWPLGQNIEHDFFVSNSLLHPATLTAFLGLLSLLVMAAFTIRKYRLLGFGILWFFITLSVTSSIIPNTIFVAEHRVYLPMIGLTFVIAGLYRYLRRPRIFWSIAMPIILILSVLTFVRNQVWKDDLTLWRDALEKSPAMSRPYVNYARALHGLGRSEEAIALYEEVLIRPAVPYKSDLMHRLYALGNLGTLYAEKGMYQQALKCYEAAAQTTAPLHASNLYFNMGNLFAELKQYIEAIESYRKAVEKNSNNYRALTNLGWVLTELERYNEAEIALKEALKYNRRSAETYLNLAALYSKDTNKRAEAIANYNRFLELKPNSPLGETVMENIKKLEQKGKSQRTEVSGRR